MLRRILGAKWVEVTEGWGKLNNDESLNNLYSSPDVVRIFSSWKLKMTGSLDVAL
jgi:hypothetical protein